MGCSPSRGNRFTGAHSPFDTGNGPLPPSQEHTGESQPGDGTKQSAGAGTDGEQCSWTAGERQATAKYTNIAMSAKKAVSDCGDFLDKLAPQEITVDILSQIKQKHGEKNPDTPEKKPNRKSKKPVKGLKASRKKEKEKKTAVPEAKVDFPELLVKAHQAAYSYLNPSITKYEVLLGLLDNATQTQLLLQPMVSFMLMRYEEINRGLEEIVEEGEKLLKENGEHLAWPCPLKNLSTTPTSTNTPSTPTSNSPTEPPPDLLQQLLQYTIQRMHSVSQSVSGVGDTALEEAVDYFTSVSDVLEDKLKVKRASEARLMQLLSRIEAASLRRPGPEDSALFSEDSGIGGESESLLGLDRHRHRRESCESSATTRTSGSSPMGVIATSAQRGLPGRYKPAFKRGSSLSLTSLDSFCNLAKDQMNECLERSNSIDNGNDGDDDDEKEVGKERENEEGEESHEKCPTSSPRHAGHQPRRLPSRRIENPQNIEMTLKLKDAISGRIRFLPSEKINSKTKQPDSPRINRRQWSEGEITPKRPQTPTPKRKTTLRHRRAHSADSIRKTEDTTRLELERTQKDLSQRIEKMSKAEGNIRSNGPKHGKGKTQPTSPSTSARLQPLQKTPRSPSKSHKKSGHAGSSAKETEVIKDSSSDIPSENKNDLDDKLDPKQTPSSPTLHRPAGVYRGRNNVKRLIDTFSQGVEEVKQTPENSKILGPLKGVIKCGVPIIPGLGGAALAIGNDDIRADSRSSDRINDVDIDNLPPPPLEVLMDNSFENVPHKYEPEEAAEVGRGHSPLLRRATVTQRLRASMQSVSVLPSRGNVRPGALPPCAVQQEVSTASVPAGSYQECVSEVNPDSSAASLLPKRLQRMGQSTERKGRGQQSPNRQKDSIASDTVPSTSESNSHSVAKSKSKRVRMLPTTPVVNSSSLQRRLPSPPVHKRQPTPPSTPPTTRKLPTPPPVSQRRHNSPSATKQKDGPPTSTSTHAFKTPSPPASPKTQRWSRDSSSDASSSSSRVSSNARSVFCPASPCLFEAKPCPVPRKPQAWASKEAPPAYFWSERWRVPVSTPGPRPYVRRSQSERRPSLNSSNRTSPSVAETCGSEPAIATQEWDSNLDITATIRSVSHPNLCIVGQALFPE